MARISTAGRWRMQRRQGGFSLPAAIAERLEGALRSFGNRDAAAALARLLALAHRRAGKPFACCRRALAAIAELSLSEDQVRSAIAVLERVGFLDRIGGGAWDRDRQRNKPVIWRLGWAARNPPTEGRRPKDSRSGGNAAPKPSVPILGPLSGLRGLIPSIASGGELAAVRQAAQLALDRLRGGSLPALSTAALTAGRRFTSAARS